MRSGLRRRKPGKGHGENNISNGFLRFFAEEVTNLEYPLYIKSFLRMQPALQWKGGMAAALFKGKGSATDMSNYRDILLGNDNGKAFSGHVRRVIRPLVSFPSLGSQYGSGLNGGETAIAHLYMRSVIDASRVMGC